MMIFAQCKGRAAGLARQAAEFTHWRESGSQMTGGGERGRRFHTRRDFAVYMTEQLDQRAGTKSARRVEAEAIALTPHRAGYRT